MDSGACNVFTLQKLSILHIESSCFGNALMKIDDKFLPVGVAADKARRRGCGPFRALTNYKTAGGIKIIIRAPTRDNKQKLRTS